MFVTDGVGRDVETLNYAGSSHRPNHDHHRQSKGKGGGKGHGSKLPCYAYQRNKKCAFGSRCKYSHDEDVLNSAPPPPSVENMAALVDSFVELNIACAAQQQNYKNRMKKMKKTLKNFKKKIIYPDGQTYQKVADAANAAVAEDKTDPPISLMEETSDGDTSTGTGSDFSD